MPSLAHREQSQKHFFSLRLPAVAGCGTTGIQTHDLSKARTSCFSVVPLRSPL